MFNTNKKKILILGTPRSGTGPVTSYISRQFNDIKSIYFEPDSIMSMRQGSMSSFINTVDQNKDFIAKIQIIRLTAPLYNKKIIDYLLYDSSIFRIGVKRKNIINQISSLYLSLTTPDEVPNKWHQDRADEYKFYVDEVKINYDMIIKSINLITKSYKLLHDMHECLDTTIWYEDFPLMDDIPLLVGPKPNNYDQVKSTVETYYNKLVQEDCK